MCGCEDEDVEHLFLHCNELCEFIECVKCLLMDHCRLEKNIEWEWTFLFCLPVLSLVRLAILSRRNFALYEQKCMCVKRLFINGLKAHLRLLHGADRGIFFGHFGENYTLGGR